MQPRPGDLVFHVHLVLKADHVDAWQRDLRELIERMAREPAFVSCHWQRDAANPNAFTLFEVWREESVATFMANQVESKPYRLAYEARLPDYLELPRTASVSTLIDAWI